MDTAAVPTNEQLRVAREQQTQRTSFYMLLFLLAFLFFNFSDDTSARTGKPTKSDVLDDLQHEKELLDNLTFGVNVTHVNTRKIPQQSVNAYSYIHLIAFTCLGRSASA
ncbi:hypothetical protein BD408DRAFT_43767 [Parasitella parasitica]|nr:hypothetical protein BD408DRAFT_43767 [Parasitella parasitica]